MCSVWNIEVPRVGRIENVARFCLYISLKSRIVVGIAKVVRNV